MMSSPTMKLPASILFGFIILTPSLGRAQAPDVPNDGGKVIGHEASELPATTSIYLARVAID